MIDSLSCRKGSWVAYPCTFEFDAYIGSKLEELGQRSIVPSAFEMWTGVVKVTWYIPVVGMNITSLNLPLIAKGSRFKVKAMEKKPVAH